MTDSPSQAGIPGLEAELRSLVSSLALPEVDDHTVRAVMAQLDREPAPAAPGLLQRAGHTLRSRWRIASVALAATLAVLLVVTPAGAKVREWLGFGAVVVEQQQPFPTNGLAAPQSSAGSPATTDDAITMTPDQARAAVAFPIDVPSALGEPAVVTVSTDGRVVSMDWPDSPLGAVRLDQIDGALSPYFLKKFSGEVEFTVVNGGEALWLPEPHPVMVLNSDGSERAETARLSGPSLVWQAGDVTLRLEGVDEQATAVMIAESLPR